MSRSMYTTHADAAAARLPALIREPDNTPLPHSRLHDPSFGMQGTGTPTGGFNVDRDPQHPHVGAQWSNETYSDVHLPEHARRSTASTMSSDHGRSPIMNGAAVAGSPGGRCEFASLAACAPPAQNAAALPPTLVAHARNNAGYTIDLPKQRYRSVISLAGDAPMPPPREVQFAPRPAEEERLPPLRQLLYAGRLAPAAVQLLAAPRDGRPVLVLDLDKTLIYAVRVGPCGRPWTAQSESYNTDGGEARGEAPPPRGAFQIKLGGRDDRRRFFVWPRPHVYEFLSAVRRCYSLVLFTAGTKPYADMIVAHLESHVLKWERQHGAARGKAVGGAAVGGAAPTQVVCSQCSKVMFCAAGGRRSSGGHVLAVATCSTTGQQRPLHRYQMASELPWEVAELLPSRLLSELEAQKQAVADASEAVYGAALGDGGRGGATSGGASGSLSAMLGRRSPGNNSKSRSTGVAHEALQQAQGRLDAVWLEAQRLLVAVGPRLACNGCQGGYARAQARAEMHAEKASRGVALDDSEVIRAARDEDACRGPRSPRSFRVGETLVPLEPWQQSSSRLFSARLYRGSCVLDPDGGDSKPLLQALGVYNGGGTEPTALDVFATRMREHDARERRGGSSPSASLQGGRLLRNFMTASPMSASTLTGTVTQPTRHSASDHPLGADPLSRLLIIDDDGKSVTGKERGNLIKIMPFMNDPDQANDDALKRIVGVLQVVSKMPDVRRGLPAVNMAWRKGEAGVEQARQLLAEHGGL